MTDSSNQLEVHCPKIVVTAARSHLIESFRELNLYSNDPLWSLSLRNSEQILSTRLFLLLTSTSLLIVIFYSSLLIVNHEKTLHKFTLNDFEYYEKNYPNTINALCDEISIPYNKFLSLSFVFHEVCSSEFIGDKWISSLFLLNATSHNILDYRRFGFAHFRVLRLLCKISYQTVKDINLTFNSTNLNNREVLSRIQFNELSSVLFTNLRENSLTDEKRTGNIISMLIGQSCIYSALGTNYYQTSIPGSRHYTTYASTYFQHNQTDDSICDCRLTGNQCVYPAGSFYNWTLIEIGKPAKNDPPPRFQIPGLMAGCLPLDAMRQSTLECLYNQTCVNAISLQPNISQPKALNLSLTRFLLNSTIGSLFDEELFIETANNESNYENYFAACAPQSLSYSYQAPFHFPTIFSLTVNAFSGLMIAWKIITPVFIKICKRKKQPCLSVEQTLIEKEIIKMTPIKKTEVLKTHVKRTIHNFNLFPSDKKNDLEEERIGIITTRLYIFLILTGIIILGFYTGLSEHNRIKIIKNPSLSKFKELNFKYSSKLNCPCSRFSMSYGRIMSFSHRYHPICSSEYLKEYWLSYFGLIGKNFTDEFLLTTDFRLSGQSFFQLIQVLCKTSNETIENAIRTFKTNRLVSVNTLRYKRFRIETESRLASFKQQTISSFKNLIQLIRLSIQTNQLAEEISTNLGPYSTFINETSSWLLRYRPRSFYTNSCSCALTNECTRPVGFHLPIGQNPTEHNISISIPGLVLGCYVIDSVLLSTLECFYNKTCIKLLIDNYDFGVVDLVRPLDNRAKQIQPLSNNNSHFLPNTTIDEIFSQLFVEDWNNSTNFTAYYSRCKPTQCTFTQRKHFDIAFMIAFMLGFCGALVVLLEIILPPIVKLFMKLLLIKRKKCIQKDQITTLDLTVNMESSSKENIFKRLLSLNFFVSNPPSIEDQYKNQEIIATRIYILLFLLSMIVAFVYFGPFSEETKTIRKENPSIDVIHNLYKQNISSLSCPCSKVAIPYSSFLSIEYKRYPICSSKFVSLLYQSNLYNNNSNNMTLQLVTHYRILSTLCYLSNEFIKNANKLFNNRELITIEPLTNLTFNIQIESLILSFIRQTKFEYRRKLSFVINSFRVNQLLNLFLNNWKIDFTNQTENYLIKTTPHRFSSSNCTCAISSRCNEQLINDIHIGCFPYDGFRFSKYKNISYERLNHQLFVQTWINQTNYTKYFETCQPLECQFTVSDKNNPRFILTTLLGLYGGLVFFLRLIVGQFLLAYRWWINRNK